MQLRSSTCIGLPLVDLDGHQLGWISGILIHPDKGEVEGFFVKPAGLLAGTNHFITSLDIVKFSTEVQIRDSEVIAPVTDRIRLEPLVEDPRKILGQKIVMVSGETIGMCKDVQFDSKSMKVSWLFPKGMFRWKGALPITIVKEVTEEGIVVEDLERGEVEKEDREMGVRGVRAA